MEGYFATTSCADLLAQNYLKRKTLLNVLNLIADAKNVARSAPFKKHLQLAQTPHSLVGDVSTCCPHISINTAFRLYR